MFICMRTTLNLDDALMSAVKRRAAETGRTMTAIIEEALRDHLDRAQRPKGEFEFRWVTVRGKLRAGVDLADRDALYERMEGRG